MLAQSGVGKSITKAGAYLGSPAKEYSQAVRIEGGLRMLPQLLKDVQDLTSQTSNFGAKKINMVVNQRTIASSCLPFGRGTAYRKCFDHYILSGG
jgi:hypothetical protein